MGFIRHPVKSSISALNHTERAGSSEITSRRIQTMQRTAAYALEANLKTYYEQLGAVREAIRYLGQAAISREVEGLSDIEIIRPLRQDRLYGRVTGSKKYSRLNVGDGFTLHEYLNRDKGLGTSNRRFHVVKTGGLKGIALPYEVAGEPNITKRLRLRSNGRPEDLAIALDGSERSWAGVYVPYGVAPQGAKDVPVFGVLEDPKTKPHGNNAIESIMKIEPGVTDASAVTTKTHWLAGIEVKLREKL